MRKMNQLFFSMIFLTQAACQTASFDSKKKVEVDGSIFTRTYKQGGKNLDMFGMISGLKEESASRSSASTGELWFWGAAVAGAFGGWNVGMALANSDERGRMTAGLGFIGLATLFQWQADKNFESAIKSHNSKRSEFFVSPQTVGWSKEF